MRRYNIIKKIANSFFFNRYITIKKLLNLGLIFVQHQFIKNLKVIGYPVRLVIEPTNFCNLDCPLCFARKSNKELERGFMSFDNFKKIIDELKGYLFEVDLFNFGESLLNKDTYKMIKYANEKNIKTNLNTNLNIVDVDKLVDSNLDVLIISAEGITPKTYNMYRKGGDFEKFMTNLREILKKKKKKTKIVWQFLVMKHNEHEIQKLKKLTKKMGIGLDIRLVRLDTTREGLSKDILKKRKDNWLPKDSKKIREEYKTNKKGGPKTCLFIWNQAVINWNGSVTPCCAILDSKKYGVGSLKTQKFMEIWNNKHYQNIRKMVREMKINPDYPMCSRCIEEWFIDV